MTSVTAKTILAPPAYRRHSFLATLAFAVLIAVAGPLVGSGTVAAHLIDLWLVYCIAAVGFYLVYALAGRFSFCHTFMMLLGAYAAAWASRLPLLAELVVVVVIVAAVATVFSLAVSRSTQFYFAIATLGLTQLGTVVFEHWTAFTGPDGTVNNIPFATLFGYRFTTDRQMFWLLLAAVLLAIVGVLLVERSPLGREAIAGRDLATVAATAGLPVVRVQVQLFVMGSVYGAVAGALYGHWTGFVAANSFGLDLAIGIFLMVILGGSQSLWGAVLGAGFYVVLPEVLVQFTQFQSVVYGALLVLILIVFPRGFLGLLTTLSARARQRIAGRRRRG